MADKLEQYQQANQVYGPNLLWPLYGAGFENLGRDGQPHRSYRFRPTAPMNCSFATMPADCASPTSKSSRSARSIRASTRNISQDPVVLGHEVTMTVVGVGENLRDQYQVGDRFIVQADIFVGGVGYAYGYMIQGGLSKYGVIDQRILNGDDGNYLIPVQPETGYAESALTEPWACVIAAYQLEYRTALKPGGVTWIIGAADRSERAYTISQGFDEDGTPGRLLLTNVPTSFLPLAEARAPSDWGLRSPWWMTSPIRRSKGG